MMQRMATAPSIAVLALVYLVAARLALGLAVVHPYATAVWPPTGIALAVLLIFGRRLWPGVTIGAFLANLTIGAGITPGGALASAGIAAGNTLEAVVGAYLVQRFAGGTQTFDRARDVLRFAVLAAGASTLISAVFGMVSLALAGLAQWQDAGAIGATWWIGDACGDLVVAPVLLLWYQNRRIKWSGARALEAALATLAAATLAVISFTPLMVPHGPGMGLAFLCTPALLWAAFRFGRREAATALLLVEAIAIWASFRGMISGELSPTYVPLELQAYMGVTSIMLLAVAAEIFQRHREQAHLRLVIDGVPGLVAYIDRDLRYRFVNRTYSEWFGRPKTEIEHRTIGELVGTEWVDSLAAFLDQAFAGDQVTFERRIAYPDRPRTVRAAYVPDRASDGFVRGIVSLVQDITAEAQALRALQESEERFRRIVETASEGIWITNPDSIITFANPRMCEILGYSLEELLGRSCFDFIVAGDGDRARSAFAGQKLGETHAREYRACRKDNSMIWLQFTGAPIHDRSGNLTGVLGMCTDVTERKYNEARYQTLFSASQDGILIVNDEGIYVEVNQSMCDFLRASRDRLIGSPFASYIPPERLPDAQAAFQALMSEGHYEGEFPVRAADGSLVDLEWRSIANFVPGLHCCVARDVRERNRFQEQLQQTQKLEGLGLLAGGIAHDFNNLLVGILGNASLALDTLGSNAAKPMLQDVVTAAERAARLARQLLAYAGKGQLTTATTDLNALVSEIAPLLRTSIPKTVYLNLELQHDLPCVDADQVQLQQVIMNMVINGAEAIPDGHPGTVTVNTCARQLTSEDRDHSIIPLAFTDQVYAVLTFTDTGEGIAPDVQRKIFDPFFTTKFAGRGLGLSAVLGIVRSHHGALTLHSTVGRGTVFRVLLPVSKAPRPVAASPARVLPAQRRGMILVVDDEEIVRAVGRRALESRGYSVLTAEHGERAIEVLAAHPEIMAVVLDLAMPVMTGDQAAPRLREHRPDLPIILSSGYPEGEAMRRFARYGITAFMQKPYTANSLSEMVASVLG
jgi:two-component system, cell cycle sensor histidine kinase and response regulator CckA